MGASSNFLLAADVIVFGSGPSGIMAALGVLNTNPGAEVVCIGLRHPRYRIGEALLTGTVFTMTDAGIDGSVADAGFHKKIGAAYRWGESDEPWYVNYPNDPDPCYSERFRDEGGTRFSIHVPRDRFDELLIGEAISRGVRFVDGQVEAVNIACNPGDERNARIIGARTSDGKRLRARWFIDATGQSALTGKLSKVRDKIGFPRVARHFWTGDLDWSLAERCWFDIHRTNLISAENGWMWVIHLGDAGRGLTSVGFVGPGDRLRSITPENMLDAFPELSSMFGFKQSVSRVCDPNGAPVTKLIGHPDYAYRNRHLVFGNWLTVGDAALFLDPILSQGVTLAMHYGWSFGKSTGLWLEDGDRGHLEGVEAHYYREAAILARVVDQWYGADRYVAGWKKEASDIASELGVAPGNHDEAFRFVTNLENITSEYHPYTAEQQAAINQNLKLGA